MLGYSQNDGMKEYLRLYIALHGDHEGGNVSAHTARMWRNVSVIGAEAVHFIRSRRECTLGSIPLIFRFPSGVSWTSAWFG